MLCVCGNDMNLCGDDAYKKHAGQMLPKGYNNEEEASNN